MKNIVLVSSMYNIEHDFVLRDMDIGKTHPLVLIHFEPSFLRSLLNVWASFLSNHPSRAASALALRRFLRLSWEFLGAMVSVSVGLKLSFGSPGATEPDAVGSSTEVGNPSLMEICGVVCCGFLDEVETIERFVFWSPASMVVVVDMMKEVW
jgi:hypothetical protein